MTDANASEKPYSVVVGIDYSEASALAVSQAVALARSHRQTHIHVLHALQGASPRSPGIGAPVLDEAQAREMQTYVEKTLSTLSESTTAVDTPSSSLLWSLHLRLADPAHAIAQLAADTQADLVVVGTHGRSWLSRFVVGSVAQGVVRLAPCPVLVARPVGVESASDAPKIEPACPLCLEARSATGGKQFWCARHSEHHDRAHTYHFSPVRESHQSGLLYPSKS